MKKKLSVLAGGVVLLAALLGIYAVKTNKGTQSVDTETTTENSTNAVSFVNSGKYTLCEKQEDISDITITAGDNKLVIKCDGGSYTVEGYEDIKLNTSNTASLASMFKGLYSDNKIEDNDPAKYGLDSPLAAGKAVFADGGSAEIKLGSLTADKKYYYAQTSEADGIYMIDAVVGERLLYTANDLVDKSITAIKPNYVQYIEVKNVPGEELLLYYDAQHSNANSNLANNGLATLTMQKPLEGASVYPYNLTDTILSTCTQLKLDRVVEAKPTDYAKYGLDAPRTTVRLKDNEGELEIRVGKTVEGDDSSVYVCVDDNISVFTMSEALIEPFTSYTITDFTEKFVALHARADVDSVKVSGEFGGFELRFAVDGEHTVTKTDDGKVKDTRIPQIDGKEIPSEEFTDFYELLVGLSFDEVTSHTDKTGQPAASISYTLLDGSVHNIDFYSYNDNFYIVGAEGEYDMLVNKQSLKQVIDRAKALAK